MFSVGLQKRGENLENDVVSRKNKNFLRSHPQPAHYNGGVSGASKEAIPMRAIRLVFISASALTRNGIAHLVLRSEQPIELVGAFSDFQAARQYLDVNPIDVILVDEALPPHTDLLRTVKSLRIEQIGAAVIVILQRPTASLVQQLLAYGVRGILHKHDDLESYLVHAIMWGKQRGIQISPGVSHLIDSQRKIPAALSQRDVDVLRLLADGLEPKEIAREIGVGSNTVYRILRSIREVLHAQNNAHLITITHQMKLFEPDGVA
jgi:two-component system, NarL family, response regulator DevR